MTINSECSKHKSNKCTFNNESFQKKSNPNRVGLRLKKPLDILFLPPYPWIFQRKQSFTLKLHKIELDSLEIRLQGQEPRPMEISHFFCPPQEMIN